MKVALGAGGADAARTGGRSVNEIGMIEPAFLEDLARYVGFSDRDAAVLRELRGTLEPYLPRVIDRFYGEILRHAGAKRILSGGEAQLARLRAHLYQWLHSLLSGPMDAAYLQQRFTIGQVHVRVGLPQQYMVAAMHVIRDEFDLILNELDADEAEPYRHAIQKALSIDLATMLESYKNSYAERVRELERAAIEDRFSRVEQLALIGQLAASLAHEIKNPLAGISGAIQVIRDDTAVDHGHRPILEEILRQISRLDGTIKDLLNYARPQPARFKLCRLHDIITRVATLLRREPAVSKVRLEYADCSNVEPLFADEHQIEQLLINLLLNAAHASRPGSPVTLRGDADERELRLLVEDRGHGMDEETRRQAFKAFFTTKARGTGLGLPICQRIVDAHGGTISLRSEPGKGTCVEVKLPRRRPPEEHGN